MSNCKHEAADPEMCIMCLRAERDALRARLEMVQSDWASAVRRAELAEAKLDASERACAEMRDALQGVMTAFTGAASVGVARLNMDQILKALSDAGRDYVPRSELDAAWRKGMSDAHAIVWRANDDVLDSRNPVNVVRQLCDDIRKTRDSKLPTEPKPTK